MAGPSGSPKATLETQIWESKSKKGKLEVIHKDAGMFAKVEFLQVFGKLKKPNPSVIKTSRWE